MARVYVSNKGKHPSPIGFKMTSTTHVRGSLLMVCVWSPLWEHGGFRPAQPAPTAHRVDLKETQVKGEVLVRTQKTAQGPRHSRGSVWQAGPGFGRRLFVFGARTIRLHGLLSRARRGEQMKGYKCNSLLLSANKKGHTCASWQITVFIKKGAQKSGSTYHR